MKTYAAPRFHHCLEVAGRALASYGGIDTSTQPPVPIDLIVAALGFQVVRLFTLSDEFSGIVSPEQKLIGINGKHHRHRQRFSLAHEISHILLRHPAESRCTSRQIVVCNIEADTCASELLIPEVLLRKAIQSNHTTHILSLLFDVSKEAMERKIAQMGIQAAFEGSLSGVVTSFRFL